MNDILILIISLLIVGIFFLVGILIFHTKEKQTFLKFLDSLAWIMGFTALTILVYGILKNLI